MKSTNQDKRRWEARSSSTSLLNCQEWKEGHPMLDFMEVRLSLVKTFYNFRTCWNGIRTQRSSEIENFGKKNIYEVIFLKSHIDPWRSVHIDDLKRSKDIVSDIKALRNLTISQLFEEKKDEPEGEWPFTLVLMIMTKCLRTDTLLHKKWPVDVVKRAFYVYAQLWR